MRISDWSSDVCSSDLQVMVGDTTYDRIGLGLEGAAKGGVKAGRDGHVRNVHAKGAGDDTIVAETRDAVAAGHRVTVVTADQLLRALVQGAGAMAMSPSWRSAERRGGKACVSTCRSRCSPSQ